MWRFILISFGFLGFAFYEASGGSDYAPAPNSLQVVYQDRSIFAEPRALPAPVQMAEAETALPKIIQPIRRAPEQVARTQMNSDEPREPTTFAGLSGLSDDASGGFGITLAAMTRPLIGGSAMEASSTRAATFNAETLVRDVRNMPIDEAVIASLAPSQNATQPSTQTSTQTNADIGASADIRVIAGDSANMRSGPGTDYGRVDQLSRGTSVEVLDRRGAWVELRDLDTGQTGWMADWLVTAAN